MNLPKAKIAPHIAVLHLFTKHPHWGKNSYFNTAVSRVTLAQFLSTCAHYKDVLLCTPTMLVQHNALEVPREHNCGATMPTAASLAKRCLLCLIAIFRVQISPKKLFCEHLGSVTIMSDGAFVLTWLLLKRCSRKRSTCADIDNTTKAKSEKMVFATKVSCLSWAMQQFRADFPCLNQHPYRLCTFSLSESH